MPAESNSNAVESGPRNGVVVYGVSAESADLVRKAAEAVDMRVVPLRFGRELESHAALNTAACAILPLDDDGLDWQIRLADSGSPIACVFIAGGGAISTKAVVRAMREGAADVVALDCDVADLTAALCEARRICVSRLERLRRKADAQARLDALNPGELDVLRMVIEGRGNKSIAAALGIALRTVEARRQRIFQKLRTRSLGELATLMLTADRARCSAKRT